MSEPLRPQSLGEILDRTAQVYRSRFLVYLGIGVVPTGILVVFAALSFALLTWAGVMGNDPADAGTRAVAAFLAIGVVGLIGVPAYIGASSLGWAALCDAASRGFLGERVTIRGSFGNAWRRGWNHVGLYLLIWLSAAIGPFMAFFIFLMIVAGLGAWARSAGMGDVISFFLGASMFVLLPGLFVFAVWMLLRLGLAFPASVVEEISVWSAVKRAAALSAGTKGRMILLLLLGYAVNMLLLITFMVLFVIIMALIPGSNSAAHAQREGQILIFAWYGLSFAVQAFTRPVYGIGLTLFYFDQRIRKEGFDIEWMMSGAGMMAAAAPPVQAEAQPWLPPIPPVGSAAPDSPPTGERV
jgi:hypothetical protein